MLSVVLENNDDNGMLFEVLQLMLELLFAIGDCILWKPEDPSESLSDKFPVSLCLAFIRTGWLFSEVSRFVGLLSLWANALVLFLDLFAVLLTFMQGESMATGAVCDGWGVVDLCCFSICSRWAAGFDIKRNRRGFASFGVTAVFSGFGGSRDLYWPVFT